MARSVDANEFVNRHTAFFQYVLGWLAELPRLSLSELTDEGRNPRKLGVLGEDLVNGFVTTGRLASPRIAAVVPEVVRLFRAAYALGVKDFVLPQDAHPADSPEFDAYGPHCVVGSVEAETVDELKALPFFGEFTVMPKLSLNPAIGTNLEAWIDDRPEMESIIVAGDCTDLCVYQAAMHIKIRANAMKRRMRVIVPEDCVQTYDLGVEEALAIGATPHDGDLMHALFLYHMALNDITIAKHID